MDSHPTTTTAPSPEPRLLPQVRVTTTPTVIRRLVSSLADFDRIAPDLAPLNGTGGAGRYALVTDGVDIVLVNAEGYVYPRYRSARIAAELLPEIGVREAWLLCARKECHDPELRIATREDLRRRCQRP